MESSVDEIVFQCSNSGIVIWCLLILGGQACSKSSEEEIPLPFYNTADFAAEWISPDEKVYDSIHRVADFAFLNQAGTPVSAKSLEGKIYAANFFFTSCPKICPKMTDNFHKVQAAYEEITEVNLLSFSVMPWVDSVARLQQYALENDIRSDKWHLLTGDQDSIYYLARHSFFAEKNIGLQKNSDQFLHTENVLLVDYLGRIRGIYNGTLELEMDRLIEDIRILKKERFHEYHTD